MWRDTGHMDQQRKSTGPHRCQLGFDVFRRAHESSGQQRQGVAFGMKEAGADTDREISVTLLAVSGQSGG